MTESYTERLASFAAATSYDDIPPKARHATKRLIVDTIACSVGGYTTDAGKLVAELKRELGGAPESTVMAAGYKTSCASAAYVNAHMANALDADDTFSWTGHHANCAVMPALAVAEKVGASGKDLITAVCLGFDIAARVGFSLRLTMEHDESGKVGFSPVSGMSWVVFGSVIGSAKLLGLDSKQTANAMGLAGFTTCLPVVGKWGPSPPPRPFSKYAMYGAMAEAGVTAALLSQKGFPGDDSVLDGERGFWRMVSAKNCNWSFLTNQLGSAWHVENTSYKPYPCCRFIHGSLDLFKDIVQQHKLKPKDIDEVTVRVLSIAQYQHMHDPTVENEVDAQFSIPYLIGLTALGVTPGPLWQSSSWRKDPRVTGLARKVKVLSDLNADKAVKDQFAQQGVVTRMPATVEVKAKGKTFTAQGDYARGDPWRSDLALTDQELQDKFRVYADRLLSTVHTEQALDLLYGLEDVADVRVLTACLE